MTALWGEFRFAARLLARRPGFTLLVVATLGLGIGATSSLFSVVHGVLLQPLPYDRPDELVLLETENRVRGWDGMPLPPAAFDGLADRLPTIDAVTAWSADRWNLVGGTEPRELPVGRVEPAFFPILGVEPLLGRGFRDDEDTAGASPVVVLSEGLWRREFAADPGVLGKTLTLEDVPHTVIGVMPASLRLPEPDTGAWVPLQRASQERPWSNWSMRGLARVAPGAPPTAVRRDLEALWQGFGEERSSWEEGWRLSTTPLLDEIVGPVRRALWVLFGAVVLVLGIACVNVASLLLSRAQGRHREMSVRAALGAGRLRLLRQGLSESLLLSGAGGLVGLALAQWAVPALMAAVPDGFPRSQDVTISAGVYLFTLAMTLVTVLLAGLLPAWRASRLDPVDGLHGGMRVVAGRSSARSALVVGEVALAVVLLIGAGLMARSFARALEMEMGVRPEGVVAMNVALPRSRYAGPPQWRAFHADLGERLRALPGVQTAGGGTGLVTHSVRFFSGIEIEGRNYGQVDLSVAGDVITPGYLEAMGVPLLRGRLLDEGDRAGALEVVLINDTLARRFWPGADPVGRRIRMGSDGSWKTIVGVVGDVRQFGPEEPPSPQVYHAFAQMPVPSLRWTARFQGDAGARLEMIRTAVWTLDPEQPVTEAATLTQVLSRSTAQRRFNTLLLAAFAALALGLCILGVFGVVSCSVSDRTREIGTRIALGARTGQVSRMVLSQGVKLAAFGLGLGIAGALALGRFLEALLFGVGSTDPWTFAIIAATLLGFTAAACYLPARRAARIDPLTALRAE